MHPSRFFSLSIKQKIEFCFSLTKPKQTKRKKRRKNLTPKKCWTSILRKESQVVNRVFRNESVVFQQESLHSKLDKTQLKKIFLSLCNQRENQMLAAQLDSVSYKERSLKIKIHGSLFSCFSLNKNIFVKHSPKTEPTEFFVGAACQMRRFNLT